MTMHVVNEQRLVDKALIGLEQHINLRSCAASKLCCEWLADFPCRRESVMRCDPKFQTQPLTLRRKRSRHGKPRADGVSGLRSKRYILTCRSAIPLALVCDLISRLNAISGFCSGLITTACILEMSIENPILVLPSGIAIEYSSDRVGRRRGLSTACACSAPQNSGLDLIIEIGHNNCPM